LEGDFDEKVACRFVVLDGDFIVLILSEFPFPE
jgi:hypothetical protein